MKNNKKALLISALSLLLCCSILVGMTFAWFTDAAKAKKNIQAGNLDVGMYWTNDLTTGDWYDAGNEKQGVPFNETNWEPGYTAVRYVKIVNEGDLALKYALTLNSLGQVGKLAEVIGVYYNAGVTANVADRSLAGMKSLGYLNVAVNGGTAAYGALEAKGSENSSVIVAVALKMDESAGNEYQKETIGDGFIFNLVAAQEAAEIDGFGGDYDAGATFPVSTGVWTVSGAVSSENSIVTVATTIGGPGNLFTAQIPAGVKLEEGVTELTLEVSTKIESVADVTLEQGEVGLNLDVHISGIAKDNTVPMIIHLGTIVPEGLYDSNIKFYHVEDGVTIEMVQVATLTELDAHNEFYYNAETGEISLAMASFSTVYVSVATKNPWNGDVSTGLSGSGTESDPYLIKSASDLAYFGKSVAEGNSYSGKYVKLENDVDMGKGNGLCFYPIGCVANSGNISAFSGTFDGNYKTVSGIKQNTWEMKGDYVYPDGTVYYDNAMGLFALVEGATIKNLVIDDMIAEGEYTDIGCVTAYARGKCTFDNIRITNVSCYSYNCRTAGIVGYDWIGTSGSELLFSNIEIDPSCTFGALWGSWDVACAGILGYKNDASKVKFVNCEVGCELDVFNDVCANYQYYDYRYAGMMIGTVGKDGDPSDQINNGNITFDNCAVHYREWVNHYHCELEANSPASYTDDYQMSRLEKIYNFAEINDGSKWLRAGNFVLIEGDSKTCYHIVSDNGNLVQYNHTAEEDKQLVHTVFNQLFTGYGWGATSSATGVGINEAKYTITYVNKGKILDVTYVMDNNRVVDTDNPGAANVAIAQMGSGYKFHHWMNAGSTTVKSISAGNTEDVVLYPSFDGIYTATFVDLDGNILDWGTYTKNNYAAIQGKVVNAPEVEYCVFDHWEVSVNKDGKVTNIKLDEYKFADGIDITIYPVYTFDGDVNLIPVDNNGDGITDQYYVGGYKDTVGRDVVNIPASVNGIEVVGINADAFAGYDDLHVVVIPNTIEKIGSDAISDAGDGWSKQETVTIYYAGSYDDWKSMNYGTAWLTGLSESTRIFFLGDDNKVDTTVYLNVKHKKNFLGMITAYNLEEKNNFSSIKSTYTGACDCDDCDGAIRPDAKYWN